MPSTGIASFNSPTVGSSAAKDCSPKHIRRFCREKALQFCAIQFPPISVISVDRRITHESTGSHRKSDRIEGARVLPHLHAYSLRRCGERWESHEGQAGTKMRPLLGHARRRLYYAF